MGNGMKVYKHRRITWQQ